MSEYTDNPEHIDPPPSDQPAAQSLGMVNTASTAVSEIDPKFKDIALKKVRSIVAGNGINPKNLKFVSFDGVTLQYLATTKLQLRMKTLERIEAGKKQANHKISGAQQLRDEISKMEQKLTHRADSIRSIQAFVAEERKDMGYGLNGQMIRLPFLTTDYVAYEACQNCKAKGEVACQRCHRQGYEVCPQCHGQGLELCNQCSGSHFISTPQGRVQCPKCHGKGKTSCGMCQERRKIQCRVCKTKGSTTCTVCNGHAWSSRIYTVEVEAMPSFDLDKTNFQARVGEIIESLGPKLITDAHADVSIIYKEQDDKHSEDKRDFIAIPYVVTVPYGELQYSIGQDTHNTMIFGNNGDLYFVPMLLETLLKKPLARLKEAAENRGNVAEKIKQAGRYKTIRLGIVAAARLPLGKAALKVRRETPHGITPATVGEMIVNADKALKNITRKPRQYGMFGAFGLSAVFFLLYFVAGLRGLLMGAITHPPIAEPLIDLGALALVIFGGVYLVKFVGKRAMMNALANMIPPGKQGAFMPKAGKMGQRIGMGVPFLFLAALELARQIGQNIPWWYADIIATISALI